MKHKKLIIIIVSIFVFAAISISIGMYFTSLSKPTTISKHIIDGIQDRVTYYLFPNSNLNVGDNFKIEGNLDFDLDSEYYTRLKSTDVESQKKYNTINNLSLMQTNFTIEQNKDKKESYVTINEKIKDEKLLDTKLYITNATQYYYINGITDNYINNGTCNYFETLSKSSTTSDNIEYIYNYIFKALENNLKESYFNQKETKENIDGNNKNVHEISIRIDNDLIINVLNGVLSDLKKDKKSNKILTDIDPSFKKLKIKDNVVYLNKNETYTVYVYTTKVLYKPLKYKIVHINNNEREEYIYEGTNNGKFYYMKDGNIKYNASIKRSKNETLIKIKDSNNKEIGECRLSKNNNDINISYDITEDNKKIDLVYSSKYTNVKDKTEYKNEKLLSFKYVTNKESKLNGSIKLQLKVNNKPRITEDISEAILKSKLTEEQKNKIDNTKNRIKERLSKQ